MFSLHSWYMFVVMVKGGIEKIKDNTSPGCPECTFSIKNAPSLSDGSH